MAGSDEKRTDGRNRDFARFEQVEKDQVYRLAEAERGEEFDEDFRIRTCDIGRFLRGDAGDRRAFARELGEALREIGFAILTGHGVDPGLYEKAAERTAEVFTRPSLEEKLRYRAQRHGSVNQGYFPIKETSDIHPDLVEGWVFCRRAFDLGESPSYRAEDFWPIPEAEPFFRRLCREHEKLIFPVMQSILLDLGCDPHLYDRRLTGTNFGLRLNYYPPVAAEDDASGAARLLGHEDVDLFTLLPAPQIEGLQVLNRTNRKWVRLTAPAGTIILNTGDYMQRITNDILPSTTHRVSKPRDTALRRRPRVSFPFNVYLREEEILEVLPGLPNPKYPPIAALPFHTRITSKYYGEGYAAAAEDEKLR
jgi:isopenicillin N synthase-like dioxygenase